MVLPIDQRLGQQVFTDYLADQAALPTDASIPPSDRIRLPDRAITAYNTVVLTGHQISRIVRDPSFAPAADTEPKPWMVAPTTCARAAVRLHHEHGGSSGIDYLAASVVGKWQSHDNPSMASNASAVIAGMTWYVNRDAEDGRTAHKVAEELVVEVGGHAVPLRLDVVLNDGEQLAGRMILWDGPDFEEASAALIACPFALALAATYPDDAFTTVGVWQARRQHLVEVDFASAVNEMPALVDLLDKTDG